LIELAATSVSRSLLGRLPGSDRPGSVHSVFSRAINLRWDESGWACLLVEPRGLCPGGVGLRRLPAAEVGEPIVVSRAGMAFPERSVRVRVDRASRRDLRIRRRAPFGRAEATAGSSRLRRMVAGRGHPESLLPYVLGEVQRTVHPLLMAAGESVAAAVRASDGRGAALCLLDLVGLGAGLTPAGDDFLVGLLAASAGLGCLPRTGVVLADALPARFVGRTTEVSREMLGAACRGEFSEPTRRVVHCLAGTEAGLRRSVGSLLRVGGGSGCDTLAGILFCLDVHGGGMW